MSLDDLPCHEKPQSRAIGLLAYERLEKPPGGLGRWTGTGVLDADHRPTSIAPVRLDDNLGQNASVPFGSLERVEEKIHQQFAQRIGFAPNGQSFA